jgi:hypothetical protein
MEYSFNSSLIPFPSIGHRWQSTRFLKRHAWRVRKSEQYSVGAKAMLEALGRVFPSPSGQSPEPPDSPEMCQRHPPWGRSFFLAWKSK